MSLELFKDWIPSITQTKQNIVRDKLDEKSYDAFMINRALSLYQDCLFQANEMNRLSNLPKLMQYHYLLGQVRARKRPYVAWPKKMTDDNVKLIMRHLNYSRTKAIQVLSMYSDDQIDELKAIYKDL